MALTDFTIKQSKLIKDLFNDGFKIKKYDGLTNLILFKSGVEIEIRN